MANRRGRPELTELNALLVALMEAVECRGVIVMDDDPCDGEGGAIRMHGVPDSLEHLPELARRAAPEASEQQVEAALNPIRSLWAMRRTQVEPEVRRMWEEFAETNVLSTRGRGVVVGIDDFEQRPHGNQRKVGDATVSVGEAAVHKALVTLGITTIQPQSISARFRELRRHQLHGKPWVSK